NVGCSPSTVSPRQCCPPPHRDTSRSDARGEPGVPFDGAGGCLGATLGATRADDLGSWRTAPDEAQVISRACGLIRTGVVIVWGPCKQMARAVAVQHGSTATTPYGG